MSAIRANQPESSELPDIDSFRKESSGLMERYIMVLESIGGKAFIVKDFEEIQELIKIISPPLTVL